LWFSGLLKYRWNEALKFNSSPEFNQLIVLLKKHTSHLNQYYELKAKLDLSIESAVNFAEEEDEEMKE